ncbi:hypothetical protein Pstr01_13280 [Pseudomonas straminea]|nr:hypothetical protein Pstr01_13280 [Pseudomonas straminea]
MQLDKLLRDCAQVPRRGLKNALLRGKIPLDKAARHDGRGMQTVHQIRPCHRHATKV